MDRSSVDLLSFISNPPPLIVGKGMLGSIYWNVQSRNMLFNRALQIYYGITHLFKIGLLKRVAKSNAFEDPLYRTV